MRPRCRFVSLVLAMVCLPPALAPAADAAGGSVSPSTRPASAFDPARHMRVAEVKPGMRGHGLSVFAGTKIERFEVEVISVLENFNPKHDVILVRCAGANLEHTGSIAGMSGSPIYLTDDSGRSRMAGAFAYGWPLMKDPVGGVQPIEYMLDLRRDADLTAPATTRPISAGATGKAGGAKSSVAPGGRLRWRVTDSIPLPGMDASVPVPRDYPFAGWNTLKPNPRFALDGDGDVARLRPLATPLMTSGFSSRLLDQLRPVFESRGLVPLQSGGVGAVARSKADDVERVPLAPGSVLAVPLLTGDVDMTAIGTCTEVVDGHVFGFGHPFMSEGPVALPMGGGKIHTVIANLMTSFKLGSLTGATGAIYTDQLPGVAGRLGPAAPTVPIELRVHYADGSKDLTYKFDSALHAKYTPLLTMAAFGAAVTGEQDLPQFHTLDYDLTVTFANGKTLRTTNTAVNSDAGSLFFEIGGPMMAAADNPFERVLVRGVKGTVTVTPEARESTILAVQVPRLKHRPGETLKAYVSHRPFRSGESLIPIEFPLPRDLADGNYQLVVSDWQQYLADEQTSKPFRFTAESIGEVFDVMRDVTGVRHDALYVRLVRQPDGVAIGRTAMPNLPSSRREVLAGAGRSDTTPFISSTVKTVPTQHVMEGAAQFVVTIDKDAKVEVGTRPGGARPEPRAEPRGEPTREAKPDESKPKPGQKPDAPGKPDAKPDAPATPGGSDAPGDDDADSRE